MLPTSGWKQSCHKSKRELKDIYASQLLSKHEKNYNVTCKALLAVVTFVKKFKQYLRGRPFTIRTDHAALQWLKRTPEPIGQRARWLEFLEEFGDYSVQHRAGIKHTNAEALSQRLSAECEDCRKCQSVHIRAVHNPNRSNTRPTKKKRTTARRDDVVASKTPFN